MKPKPKRAMKVGAEKAGEKESTPLADAIAQLKEWASSRVLITFGWGVVRHQGRITELRNGDFQFVSGASMHVFLTPSSWESVRTSHIPQLGNSVHITDDLHRLEKFSLSDIEGRTIRHRVQRQLREDILSQLKAWTLAGTAIMCGNINEIGIQWFDGKMTQKGDDCFLIEGLQAKNGAVISLQEVDYISLQREMASVRIVLQRGSDSVFLSDGLADSPVVAMEMLSRKIQ
jgi:hypothetical protein